LVPARIAVKPGAAWSENSKIVLSVPESHSSSIMSATS
jgi:hypothetical protein